MHRKRTRFAARVNRVALALERRGVVATYELHDRALSNQASRRRFARHRPELDQVQRRIVDALDAEGYATVTFQELFADDGLRLEIDGQAARFAGETDAALAREGSGESDTELRRRVGKEFVVRLHSYGVELGLDDPWFRACASSRLLDIANSYLRMWSKLEYVDVWYSVPQPESAERRSSQRWHRDYNDRHLLKAFLYLVDVDEETGPFEYVPGSVGSGPYAGAWPWRPLGETYPEQEELARCVPPDAVRTFTAPKGTMIFCNTSGFHRGGFATHKPRILATVTYCSPASLASLTERSYTFVPAGELERLAAPARYALT